MVGINKKPEMSEFEKGVVHGRSLAEAEAVVVGDWEVEFNEKFIGNEMLDLLSPTNGSAENIRAYITTLLAAEREAGAKAERHRIAQALGHLIDTNNNSEPIKLGDLEQMILHPYTPFPFIQRPTPPTK